MHVCSQLMDMALNANLHITFVISILIHIFSTAAISIGINDLVFGKSLPSKDFATLYGISFRECQNQCKLRSSCQSVDYKRKHLSCRMNAFTEDTAYQLMHEPGVVHVRLREWPSGSFEIPCGSITCIDRQTCDLEKETCVYTECPKLSSPSNGYMLGNMVTVGSKVIQNCYNNTYVNNAAVVPAWQECQTNGTWSLGQLECHKEFDLCKNYLVSNATDIIAKSMTATSTYEPYEEHSADLAVLNGPMQWSANISDFNQYIEVEFYVTKHVTGVVTQGRPDSYHAQWVKSYGLAYSTDCVEFEDLRNSTGNIIDFPANIDGNTTVKNVLDTPINATCIRLKPTSFNNHISLRLDFFGCDYSDLANYRSYTIQDFPANIDGNTTAKNVLDTPINATCIRLKPTSFNNHISLRLDFFGCDYSGLANYRSYTIQVV